MNGNELMRRLKRLVRARDAAFSYDPRHGKGSHRQAFLGARITTLRDPWAEISRALLHMMLRDLGLILNGLE